MVACFPRKTSRMARQQPSKPLSASDFYLRERNVYFRLMDHEVRDVRGAAVPELLGYDDDLWVIEMTIVSRPFVLDFAGAYLDDPPDYSDEVMADWRPTRRSNSARVGRRSRRSFERSNDTVFSWRMSTPGTCRLPSKALSYAAWLAATRRLCVGERGGAIAVRSRSPTQ